MTRLINFRSLLLLVIFATAAVALASLAFAYQAGLIPASRLISPDDLRFVVEFARRRLRPAPRAGV